MAEKKPSKISGDVACSMEERRQVINKGQRTKAGGNEGWQNKKKRPSKASSGILAAFNV
jgi:hypothetical protein